ncbi:hypothetical protein AZE42_00128 [Rhizopogon vesiculosus]|uniref:Pentatricopeptide repeat protein n=1 Tax=Rhizopogon vesiculosus TaxID=180088 RepID=A0A1J8R3D5_9AGAM|nr:hypothetical protein AZE42_00128 [Rhizopogon vesiculosus]
MLHHAPRLLKCYYVLPDAASSFSAILQSAAARAWARRAEYHSSVALDKKSARVSRKPRPAESPVRQSRTHSPIRPSQYVIPIVPDSLSLRDAMWKDPGRAEPLYIQNPPSQSVTFVSAQPLTAAPIPPLPTPTSREMLYQNLLDMHNYSNSSLTTLINYHFSRRQDTPLLRSTRSFNFLVSLALRQAAFGTAARLLDAMKAESVRPNLETWKLTVRWLVRTGRWEEALRRVERVMRREQWKEELGLHSRHQGGLPLPLWTELFGSLKRGALRRWVKIPEQQSKPGRRTARFGCVVLQTHTSSASAQVVRYRSLTNILPTTLHEYSQLPPRAVFFIVQAMFQLGNRQKALETTSSYFRSLPRRLSRTQQRIALDIIHLHMRAVAEKPGLSQHFAQRRVISELLAAHPGIRPSSQTLFLTLASLRSCKRCGTLAMRCLKTFRRRWGPRTESSVVRRRIASLSVKEGRVDIAVIMLKSERTLLLQKRLWRTQRGITGGPSPRAFTRLLRRSTGKIFHARGAENWKWQALKRKLLILKRS